MSELQRYLASRIQGDVLASAANRKRFSTDFGQIVNKRPALVVRPRSENDIRLILDAARLHGIPASVQGSGCSVNGQSLSDGGLLIVLSRMKNDAPRLRDDGVEVSGGSSWGLVERWLNQRGRTVPVLADNLSLTVGGTLSVGGYGIDSVANGSQIRQVRRLKLVTPDSKAAWCSDRDDPERFRYALAGQGRLGIITRAVMATEPLRRYSVLFPRRHRSLLDMVETMAWLQEPQPHGPALFKAYRARGQAISVYGWYADSIAAALRLTGPPSNLGGRTRTRRVVPFYRTLRSQSVKLWVAHYGRRVRLWSDFLVDYAGLRSLAEQVERLDAGGGFGGALKSVYVLANRKAPCESARLPLDAAETGDGPVSFGMGLYCMAPRRRDALVRVHLSMRQCLETALASGGRPYLYGWHALGHDDAYGNWKQELENARRIRNQLDPGGLFQGGKLLDRLRADDILRHTTC